MNKGIILILISALFFSLMNTFAKLCSLPEIEKNFFMTIIAFFFAVAFFIVTKKKIEIKNKKTLFFLLLRSLFGLVGSITYLYAITNLSLADATLLNKTSPIFVILFSMMFLNEKITGKLISTLLIAMTGIIFVINPDMNYSLIPAIIGLLSGIFSGAAYVTIRYIKNDTNPETIAMTFCVVSIIVSIPLMLITKFELPMGIDILYLIGMGLCVVIAQYTLSIAFVIAKASKISIYTYGEVLISSIIGVAIWNEQIGWATIIGGGLIIIAGVVNYNKVES
ncbi:MAG: hypothetical protein A2Y22_02615 [Clostridiales bacterium GWD2_32_59]|nr:MAG: hypothetical protein A2Y22_02615 [Clostridiales bacterium GWD2_32_59]